MAVLKSFCIAFSLYSSIPVPQFTWKEEDMKYTLCFFPWVGAVIGALIYLWGILCCRFSVGTLCYSLIGAVIPVLITGGFHVDGFMDTMDAFHSYQSRERKLEILKDSHIGAFSVIMLGAYGLVYVGAFSEIQDLQLLAVFAAGFFLTRVLSGIAVVTFSSAKKDGLLFLFASSSQKRIVISTLVIQGVVCVTFMLWVSLSCGIVITAVALIAFAYYHYRTGKELGGITGDTAGYFVVLCEGCMVIAAAVLQIIRNTGVTG